MALSKKILIVEDSQTTRAVIKVYLSKYQFEFLEAHDGHTGLFLARRELPNFIIADLKMPGMNGFDFCRSVRAEKQLKHTPILVLTASKKEEDQREAFIAGANFFMSKPIDTEKLAGYIISSSQDAL
jgi:DNA-binding response OmpR family regulator